MSSPAHLSIELKDLIGRPADNKLDRDALNALFEETRLATQETGGSCKVWLIVLTGCLFTLNLPEVLPVLFTYAAQQSEMEYYSWYYEDKRDFKIYAEDPAAVNAVPKNQRHVIFVAGLMRDVGLKTVSFLGVPSVINCLAALSKGIHQYGHGISESLPKSPQRNITVGNLKQYQAQGRALWDDIYAPKADKLLSILGRSHPDMPGHILHSHYSALISPPPPSDIDNKYPWMLGRQQMSILAVTCLRAQGGVEPQVESHIHGLLKAKPTYNGKWFETQAGCIWLLQTIDHAVKALEQIKGTNAI